MKIEIAKTEKGWIPKLCFTGWFTGEDESIASQLKITKENYITNMTAKFNAYFNFQDGIYFPTKEDCQQACRWIVQKYCNNLIEEITN